jgi:hypothetical protein
LLGLGLSDEYKLIENQSFATQYLLPGVSLIVYGFCQFTAWPVLLYLVNQHFDI